MPPCLSTVALTYRLLSPTVGFYSPQLPVVASCRRPRTSFVFSNRCRHMHTPHMMNVTVKTVAAQLWRNPEHFAQQEATGNKRLPQHRIGPGARMGTEIARS